MSAALKRANRWKVENRCRGLNTASIWLRHATDALRAAGMPNADQEAGWLLEGATGRTRLAWMADDITLNFMQYARANDYLARRLAREPIQYILGTEEFCGLSMAVNSSVLIPRPETELLVDLAVSDETNRDGASIVDVGTGSGCVAIAVASRFPGARLYATDLSAVALTTARANASRHGVTGRISWLHGDLLAPLPASLKSAVDIIVSNPPYIADGDFVTLQREVALFEPRMALAGGPDGLMIYPRLFTDAWFWLKPGGVLAVEVGAGQADRVRALASASSPYRFVESRRDAAGIDRVVVFEKQC